MKININMANIIKLRAELDLGHPDTGAYNVDDKLAAAELNAANRPDDVSIEEIIKFLLMDNTHKTDGSDTQDRSIWQRMKEVVAIAIVPTTAVANPWGSSTLGTITEIQQIKTHQLLEFFTLSAQGQLSIDLQNSNFQVYVAGAESAGCMSASQETALLSLGDNLQSRASEVKLGLIRPGNVKHARAL